MSRTRAEAYRQLGVDPAQVARALQVTPHLDHIMSSRAAQGLSTDVYHYLATATDHDARILMAIYNQVKPWARRLLTLEEFCVAAGVDPISILEAVVNTIARLDRLNAAVQLSSTHPGVVRKTIDMALTDDGHRDRVTLHKAAGFLPSPKGAQTIVNVQQNASATASSQAAALAPPPEQTIRRLTDRLNAARGLPAAPAPAALTVGDHDNESEEVHRLGEAEPIPVATAKDDED